MTELLTEQAIHVAPDGHPDRSRAGRRVGLLWLDTSFRPPALVILASLAVVAAVVVQVAVLRGNVPLDYLTYRYGAQAALRGVDIYQQKVQGPLLPGQPFTYTPFAALALIPATLLSWKVSYLLWSAGSLSALWAVMRAVLPAHASRRGLTAAVLTAAAASTCIVASNLGDGQIDILLMGLCLGDLLRSGDTRVARLLPRGVLVGVATAIKITPALFIVYFLFTRQWRLAAASAGGAAAATILGAVVFPQMTATFAVHVLWTLTSRVDLGHPLSFWGNSSLTGAIHALGPWAAPLATPAVLGVATVCVAAAVRCHRRGAELRAWLIIGLAAPVLSPFSWEHHFVYLIPALVTLGWAARTSGPHLRLGRLRLAVAAIVFAGLDLGPDVGHRMLRLHSPWLAVPGMLLRESLLLTSLGCIAALSHRPASPQHLRAGQLFGHDYHAEQPKVLHLVEA